MATIDHDYVTRLIEREIRRETEKILAEETAKVSEQVHTRLAALAGEIVMRVSAELHIADRDERLVVEFRSPGRR